MVETCRCTHNTMPLCSMSACYIRRPGWILPCMVHMAAHAESGILPNLEKRVPTLETPMSPGGSQASAGEGLSPCNIGIGLESVLPP